MNVVTIRESPGAASSRIFTFCAQLLQTSQRRNQSTYRRARTRLNIKPDASFLPTTTEAHDHIIYNPPPSMPNVYHTPNVFLPRNDKRRLVQAKAPESNGGSKQDSASLDFPQSQGLPPAVREPYTKKYHLTQEHLEEIRQLRKSDPETWSVKKLAKKFDCSTLFVSIATDGLANQKREQQRRVTEVVQSRWGLKRRVAREDRAIRKEKWYRDA